MGTRPSHQRRLLPLRLERGLGSRRSLLCRAHLLFGSFRSRSRLGGDELSLRFRREGDGLSSRSLSLRCRRGGEGLSFRGRRRGGEGLSLRGRSGGEASRLLPFLFSAAPPPAILVLQEPLGAATTWPCSSTTTGASSSPSTSSHALFTARADGRRSSSSLPPWPPYATGFFFRLFLFPSHDEEEAFPYRLRRSSFVLARFDIER